MQSWGQGQQPGALFPGQRLRHPLPVFFPGQLSDSESGERRLLIPGSFHWKVAGSRDSDSNRGHCTAGGVQWGS